MSRCERPIRGPRPHIGIEGLVEDVGVVGGRVSWWRAHIKTNLLTIIRLHHWDDPRREVEKRAS